MSRPTEWLEISGDNCSIRRTLDLIGEKWTLQLIRDAANGVHRFDELRRHVGLSEAVLADRLRTLVGSGIFETREYREPGQRARNEYRLTAKGWELLPVLIALMQWGDDHLADPEGEPWQVRHKTCGHQVRAVVQCTHDHEVLTHLDTRSAPGPAARRIAS
jgi:DNA-binding HxlR family transcriptional regulator